MLPIWQKLVQLALLVLLFRFLWRVVDVSLRETNKAGARMERKRGLLEPVPSSNFKESLKVDPLYFSGDIVTIGRGPDNDVVIDDPFVSLTHAKLVWKRNRYYLEDVNSTNHTYVNEDIVRSSCPLREGDMIMLGETILRFSYQVPEDIVDLGSREG